MRHPVESLIRHHAYCGTTPDARELDALKLDPEDRAKVRQAIGDALEIRATGNQAGANQYALEASLTIVTDLPREQRDPAYAHVDPLADVDNPDQLAAAVMSQSGRW